MGASRLRVNSQSVPQLGCLPSTDVHCRQGIARRRLNEAYAGSDSDAASYGGGTRFNSRPGIRYFQRSYTTLVSLSRQPAGQQLKLWNNLLIPHSFQLVTHYRSLPSALYSFDVHESVHRNIITKTINKMQLYRLPYYSWSALHVSGDFFAHRQEHLTVFTVSGSVHPRCCSNLGEQYQIL